MLSGRGRRTDEQIRTLVELSVQCIEWSKFWGLTSPWDLVGLGVGSAAIMLVIEESDSRVSPAYGAMIAAGGRNQ